MKNLLNDLKEKVANLSNQFSNDLDMVSLKALCNMPENEEILLAITGLLHRLIEKYPENEEILGLLPKENKISLEDLIKILEETYPDNIEVITVKALSILPKGESKDKAIRNCLERLLDENSNDKNIMEYLGIEEVMPKEQNSDMIFVKGGVSNYTIHGNEVSLPVDDLYVNKYPITQGEWNKCMDFNPSEFKGERRPVETIMWIEALEFCNKASKAYGFQPAYKIEDNKLTRIIYKNGEEVYPDLVDFSKVEGYRLPTSVEWEWFAMEGELQNGEYDPSEAAWYIENSDEQTHTVGTKKPNKLGLYDCLGNVLEWCYDTASDICMSEKRPYIYDATTDRHLAKGSSYKWWNKEDCNVFKLFSQADERYLIKEFGFRVVRTANPKRK